MLAHTLYNLIAYNIIIYNIPQSVVIVKGNFKTFCELFDNTYFPRKDTLILPVSTLILTGISPVLSVYLLSNIDFP